MRRWPVEETGRNSVIPSIIPSRTTTIQIGIRARNDKSGGLTRGNLASESRAQATQEIKDENDFSAASL
jgi:hypothetical protein